MENTIRDIFSDEEWKMLDDINHSLCASLTDCPQEMQADTERIRETNE